ncbi:3-oxo-tetronate kinase [Cobetia crustatorum]|uniref:3-oxo-tetronate kinase n=1 Tax=Cobetia crustatorum TaxID=553385 RepID=UPI00046A28D7|nr:3-oxo-tetronate kinase [Cobetia crustatorum]
MPIVLGGIADDFTGATDLANNLVRAGMRTVQVIGVPQETLQEGTANALDLTDVDAVVIALKSRSCPVDQAISESLAALEWLKAQGARQLFFKYCSTFDSTPEGNIGPVADALLEALDSTQTAFVPAFPINGRSVYQGHLFVGDRLLNDSGMQHHPLNPMTDADIVRVLSRQTPHGVGLLNHATLSEGAQAAGERLATLKAQGVRHVVCDSLDEQDLEVLAEALVEHALVTGGSGLAQALPAQYRRKGWLAQIDDAAVLAPAQGAAMVLSGSCSRMTLKQVAHFTQQHAAFALDPVKLNASDAHFEAALDFAREQLAAADPRPFLIYASAEPEGVKAAQASLGVKQAGELIECVLASLASTLVSEGVGRLLVAGGETSGAVVSALDIRELRIGGQIDPGVPWTQAPHPAAGPSQPEAMLSLTLKSGNFGGEDFFTRAFDVLDAMNPREETA